MERHQPTSLMPVLPTRDFPRLFLTLDEELELLPGPLSPRLQEDLVHLSTWMPFERAATELAYFTRVEVSDTSVRRHTEAAGAAYVAVQTAELERLERERPLGPHGPDVLQVSADGAMEPLVGGEWAEVKRWPLGGWKSSLIETVLPRHMRATWATSHV